MIAAATPPLEFDPDPARHQWLVWKIARDFMGRGLDVEDLVQEGNLGLMRACARFDPARGCKVSTFASPWIRQAIRRALENKVTLVRVPGYLHSDRVGIYTGRIDPDVDLPPGRRDCLAAAMPFMTHVAGQEADDGHPALADLAIAAEDEAPEPDAIPRLLAAVDALPERERAVIRMRFGLDGERPRFLREIGDLYGCTRERARQIEENALARLREALTMPEKNGTRPTPTPEDLPAVSVGGHEDEPPKAIPPRRPAASSKMPAPSLGREIIAMERIAEALEGLDAAAIRRVLTYMAGRHKEIG